ncbi:MAG: FAD-binding oxidoreductase, partial [Desulfobacterales bacterium]|nr:FAD-binding oxidoreductase [Desulfobacterales bacterium]
TIPEDAYIEFEEAVGENNVSTDPGVLETYTYMNGLAQGAFGIHWAVRPVCVILPSTTEEVQKIITTCAKYKLKCKAHSTAWIMIALANCGNCVLLDMRRMNKLEINEKDAFVITESYVTAGETQVETMKRGLNPHVVGAGPNASNLASGTSMQGTGGTSVRTSMNERNILSVEWVLPTGEVLKLGSLNSPNAGWFCGDGPGPSLRGMMRASVGGGGGNGVFTRAALKLYPWYGPAYECRGEPPFFDSVEIPFSYLRYVVWSSHDDEAEALHRLGEAELIDYNNRWAAGAFTSAMSITNEEYLEMVEKGEYKEKFENGYWTFFIHAASERSYDYRVKAFEKIIKDTNGESIDPHIFGKRSYEIALQNAVKAIWIAKSAYMPTSANTGSLPMAYETIDQCFKHALPISLDAKEKYASKDKIFNEGIDNCYACIDEDGHYIHIEHACLVEPWEPKGEPTGAAMLGFRNALDKGIGPMYASMPGSLKDTIIYQKYVTKIRRMIDPHKITDSKMTLDAVLP